MNKLAVKKKIKILMIDKEITRADIARKAHVGRAAICMVISGRNKGQRLRAAIADALGVRYEVLWGKEK